MYRKFDNLRVVRYVKNGETGFSTNLYDGTTKIGSAQREDGKRDISDIEIKLTKKGKEAVKVALKRRRSLNIDGEKTKWSPHLMVLCLIENFIIYEEVKRSVNHGNIVLKTLNEDFFQVLNIPNNPQNLAMVRKNYDNIEIFGQEFVNNYEELAKKEPEFIDVVNIESKED